MGRIGSKRSLGVLLWFCLMAVGWTQKVHLEATPLFGTSAKIEANIPLLVLIENLGASLRGVLVVEVGGYSKVRRYLYPIELPSGSRKEIVVYPYTGRYGDEIVVRLNAPRTVAETKLPLNWMDQMSQVVVAVGDEIGGLGFLIREEGTGTPERGGPVRRGERGYQLGFCRPEHFPVRANACSGANAIVLAPGAERLSEAQIRALRLWVLTGGLLIVPGGSAAIYLQNPALRSYLPVRNFSTKEVNGLTALGSFCQTAPPVGRALITQAEPTPHSTVWLRQNGMPLIVSQPYGLGSIWFLSFSPWDRPVRGWSGNRKLWTWLLLATGRQSPASIQNLTFAWHSGEEDYQSYQYQSSGPPVVVQFPSSPGAPPSPVVIPTPQQGYTPYNPYSAPYPGASGRASSLFRSSQFKLPEGEKVIAILLLYFILVVPVNFLVLRRLRAMDWTWVTTPLIALVFVFIFYRLGSQIYKVQQLSETQGTLFLQSGEKQGYAYASTLMFFPRAGRYEVAFQNAEMVESGTQEEYSVTQTDTLETIEGEPILVPGYSVRNLSFQWFRYARLLDLPGSLEGDLKLVRTGNRWQLQGTIINRLPYKLENVRLFTLKGAHRLGTLEAGKSHTIQVPVPITLEPPRQVAGGRRRVPVNVQLYSQFENDPLLVGLFTRQAYKPQFVVLKATGTEPDLSPSMEQKGSNRQQLEYYCIIPLQGSK